jgi:hypothetical protein
LSAHAQIRVIGFIAGRQAAAVERALLLRSSVGSLMNIP